MNFKEITATMAYRMESIVFSQDGGLHATIQVGAISEHESGHNFEPIASQSHYLGKDEIDSLLVPALADGEQVPLRDLVEYCLEGKLREKGLLKL